MWQAVPCQQQPAGLPDTEANFLGHLNSTLQSFDPTARAHAINKHCKEQCMPLRCPGRQCI